MKKHTPLLLNVQTSECALLLPVPGLELRCKDTANVHSAENRSIPAAWESPLDSKYLGTMVSFPTSSRGATQRRARQMVYASLNKAGGWHYLENPDCRCIKTKNWFSPIHAGQVPNFLLRVLRGHQEQGPRASCLSGKICYVFLLKRQMGGRTEGFITGLA